MSDALGAMTTTLGAGLPAAVFSYVLAQRYDRDPRLRGRGPGSTPPSSRP